VSEAISTKGVTGGVIGTLTAITGFAWTMTYLLVVTELLNYFPILSYVSSLLFFTYGSYASTIVTLLVLSPSSLNLFLTSSVALAVLVFIFGTTIGFGFRNLYSKSSSSTGLVYFVAISVGTLFAGILIAMGGWFQTAIVQVQYVSGVGVNFIPLRFPATSNTLIGEILLGAVLIVIGVASIRIRKSVERRKSALAAGVLSVIGGADFALHFIINMLSTGQVATASSYGFSVSSALIPGFILFTIFTLIGFGLLLVASILWTRSFLGASEFR